MDILTIILEAYKLICVWLVTWFIVSSIVDFIWNKIKEYKRRRTFKQCKVYAKDALVILEDMSEVCKNYLKVCEEKGDK